MRRWRAAPAGRPARHPRRIGCEDDSPAEITLSDERGNARFGV
ncbi:hypothetical protein BBSC_1660 [Bifidobacterium scardovii JCM 12489 = DSM 13734]|nr:hypothetical protein BBSC_1660 [Bifidobacterium scardovii JCM 12489 = DSM 13734]